MSSRWEAVDVADEGDESGGGQEADAGDAEEVADGEELFGQAVELPLGFLDAALDVADFEAGIGEEGPEGVGQIGVGVLDEGPDRGHYLLGPHGDEDAKLAKQATQSVEAGGALAHPALPKAVE